MASRHAAIRESEDHDGQAMREGNRSDAVEADAVADRLVGAVTRALVSGGPD